MADYIRQHEMDGNACKHCGAVSPTEQATCVPRPFRQADEPRAIPSSVVGAYDDIYEAMQRIIKEREPAPAALSDEDYLRW